MKKLLLFTVFLAFSASGEAQINEISIQASLGSDRRTLNVSEEIIFHNQKQDSLSAIHLLNWISAYKSRNTPLYERKIEDRKSDLHFAKQEDLGFLKKLQVWVNGMENFVKQFESKENILVFLDQKLAPGASVKLNLKYQLHLPDAKFTGYGTDKNKIALKYFFLVPDGFPSENNTEKFFLDTEETAAGNAVWKVKFTNTQNLQIVSNLPQISDQSFEGELKNDPEFLLTENNISSIHVDVFGKQLTEVQFGYPLTIEDRRNLEFYLPLQLKFIYDKTGFLPKNIFITEKFKKKEDFFGNDDIKFWKFRFPLFTPSENIDLDYFSIISKNVVEQSFTTRKEDDHWIKNGLKTYLEIQYLDKFYKNSNLLGELPETKILGIKPLKIFTAAKLKLTDRYGIGYQYLMTQNLDQKINEQFSKLSNMNDMVISNFETGTLFNFYAEKMGKQNFEAKIKHYFSVYGDKKVSGQHFLQEIEPESLPTLIERKQRVNFSLKKFVRENDNLKISIRKKAEEPIPFKIDLLKNDGNTEAVWFETQKGDYSQEYWLKDDQIKKIQLNDEPIFPESNFRDNYLYTTGLFANTKKIRFKLIKDIPNPEYNEIYVNPKLSFNAYDNVLIGLNFKNESLFDQKFSYSLTPFFSTGTGKVTGSGGISYSFMPPDSFYRDLTFGVSGSYFHYDYGLSYRKYSGYARMNFTKEPRSTVGRTASISLNHFDKDLNPEMIANQEYGKYNLWSLGYGYSDSRLIHERYFTANLQGMEDFEKFSVEAFYRYEFAQTKKIAFRLFTGVFFRNETHDDIFDYGISKISNYAFSYGLLGQSATSGIFSQQFILAEGGFKSYIGGTANRWITSLNVDSHVWKMFNVYADAGVYKNKYEPAKFIWDSGVKVRVIPDFLEIYLPVYSSLGFEPGLSGYAKRIRYTLVLNVSAVVNTARRGWF